MTPARDVLNLRLVAPQDVKAVKNYLREIFFENEPMHQYLFRTECKDFRYFNRVHIEETIDEGLSYVYTTDNGQIVALALVGCTVRSSSRTQVTPLYLKIRPFFDMIGEEAYQITNLTETDKEACFQVISVHPDWIGNGLAKSLIEKVLASLKSHGCTHVKSYCTSAYSTKLFEKYGFKKLVSVKYADYTQNEDVVFLPDEPHTHCSFMHLKL